MSTKTVSSPLLQHAVFYKDEECLGGASILKAGPSPWEQGEKKEVK